MILERNNSPIRTYQGKLDFKWEVRNKTQFQLKFLEFKR